MEVHRILVQHYVGMQIGDPTFRRLVLQTDVFHNGFYRASIEEGNPLIPQVPPPGVVYPEDNSDTYLSSFTSISSLSDSESLSSRSLIKELVINQVYDFVRSFPSGYEFSRDSFHSSGIVQRSTDIHMPASVQNSFLEQLQWHLCLMSWPFELGTNSTLGNYLIGVLKHSRPPEEPLYVCQGFGHTKMISNSQLFMDAQTCDRGFLPLLLAS
ncbi:Cobalt-precorrin-5B C(1)-methyltransferase [Frankliniella fusca]|uniref:Cobalt-precorrin-5B C(1)-methyltransferase n=1 Tax=Frankliniella fusca TaxID=407009 RepID=A0AAE1LLZ0_9NEOP|nr:Cobalt-precorrin-5B C(1)-methyltransferase [Frankliniella fusca]